MVWAVVTKRDLLAQFGARLRQLRTDAALTQEELAARADLGFRYISDIERGVRNPTMVSIVKLAKALGCEPGELFRWAKEARR
jgi:transcriptional regulator with XRE-family HTH domain